MIDTQSHQQIGPEQAVAGRLRPPRRHVVVEVTYESDDNLYVGFSANLSEGGIFIATYNPLPIGTCCTVECTLPGTTEPVRATAIVRWIRNHDAGPHCAPGMGLQFLSVNAKGQRALLAFMAMREPFFYVD